jgi:hypothetical protein
VEPYVESIATFLPYPGSRVQVIAVRFHEVKGCESGQVLCERWFDPQEGGGGSSWIRHRIKHWSSQLRYSCTSHVHGMQLQLETLQRGQEPLLDRIEALKHLS